MTPSFNPQLVNGPFQDPALYIDFLYQRRGMLFDLGDVTALSPRFIQKISHVFISHTHIDHFIGLDHMLRLLLGRDHRLTIFGPPMIIRNVAGKLAAYTWNLVENYQNMFEIQVVEVHPDHLEQAVFRCREVFRQETIPETGPFSGLLMDEDAFRIHAVHLDHGTPCLAFSLEEKFHINIKKDRLDDCGLPTGPWLSRLKAALRQGRPADYPLTISKGKRPDGQEIQKTLGWFREQDIYSITRGQKIVYVVDIGYTPHNLSLLVPFARDADYLFCEAAFLEEDSGIAAQRHHLTASQAGLIARQAGARRLIPFHFSPRYQDRASLLYSEAEQAFKGEE